MHSERIFKSFSQMKILRYFSIFKISFFEIAMAFGSAPAPTNVVVTIVVDIKDCPCLVFKK